LSLVKVMCYQVEDSASGLSLVQRSRTECGVSECDLEASIMRRLWHTVDCRTMEKPSSRRQCTSTHSCERHAIDMYISISLLDIVLISVKAYGLRGRYC